MTENTLGSAIARLQSLREMMTETRQAVGKLELEIIQQMEANGQSLYEDAKLSARIPVKREYDVSKFVSVMGELGIDISGHESKSLDRYRHETFDLVVTVCDHARETCPTFTGAKRTVHWPFDDPAAATGTEEEIRNAFRRVRDQIRGKLSSEFSP